MSNPLYLHALLNRLPEMGLGIGLLELLGGLIFRSRGICRGSLIVIFLCAASAGPVLWTGQKGYNAIYFSIEPSDRAWLDAHMHYAEKWAIGFYLLAVVALAAWISSLWWSRVESYLTWSALLLGAGMFIAAGYISYLGGRIRHEEFREGPAPILKSQDHFRHNQQP